MWLHTSLSSRIRVSLQNAVYHYTQDTFFLWGRSLTFVCKGCSRHIIILTVRISNSLGIWKCNKNLPLKQRMKGRTKKIQKSNPSFTQSSNLFKIPTHNNCNYDDACYLNSKAFEISLKKIRVLMFQERCQNSTQLLSFIPLLFWWSLSRTISVKHENICFAFHCSLAIRKMPPVFVQ